VGFANKPSRMGRMFQTPGCVCVRGRLGLFCPANPPLRVKILELLKWKRAAWRDVTQMVGENALIQNVKLSPWLCTCSLKVNTSSCWLCWLFKFLTREEFYRNQLLYKTVHWKTPLKITSCLLKGRLQLLKWWTLRNKNYVCKQKRSACTSLIHCNS